ncbi:MAG TPA: quinolinate synthase NadA [Myxococcales bacterium]|nr:quinolinate synthase NadA [Myxococcales bacterium]
MSTTTAASKGDFSPSNIVIEPDIPICQTDLPLDRYQEEFKSYAEEYLALPDRLPATVLPWMDSYIRPAMDHFGNEIMLLAHYYMGGEIVKLVERYGGHIADSYALALQTRRHPETKLFVESAVHFMAESIAILAADDQDVYITNPRAGCTMEMMAKDFMLEPAFDDLQARYGDEILVIAYMNTSGRVKAMAGRTGGSVCTSSNAKKIMQWALNQNKKIFFVPDRHLGENSAGQVGIPPELHFVWPGPQEAPGLRWDRLNAEQQAQCDRSQLILWGGFCGVHTVFSQKQIAYWHDQGYRVLVHPECPKTVVDAADGSGSTRYLWDAVMDAAAGARFAIGTEGHFVNNLREQAARKNVQVVNLADVPDPNFPSMGCGCATMSRNDPPHLVAILDLLRQGKAPTHNRVQPGDSVNERTGFRDRLSRLEQQEVVRYARQSLETMIAVTES